MRSTLLGAAVVALLVPTLAQPAAADPGDIDPGWGFLGRVGIDEMTGMPAPADDAGSILVPVSCGPDCGTVVRLGPKGQRDQTFAPAGTVPFTIGRLVRVGSHVLALGAGVARYGADGQLDRTFGTNGITALPAPSEALSAAIDGTGATYVGSQLRIDSPSGQCVTSDAEVRRLTPTGALDPTFGTAGTVRINSAGTEAPTAVEAMADGVLVGVATSRNESTVKCVPFEADTGGLVVRYGRDGRPVTSFGYNGVVAAATTMHDPRGASFGLGLITMGDRIHVAHGRELRSFTMGGALVATHDAGSVRITSLARDQHDRIILSGDHVARLTGDGRLDIGFGTCGITTLSGDAAVVPFDAGEDEVLVRHGTVLHLLSSEGGTGAAPWRSGGGAWTVTADGAVHTTGDALWCGPDRGLATRSPVVGMAAAPSGNGYWLVSADGTVSRFAHARHVGDLAGRRLNQPIVGMAPTPTGNGYWLVARDGGIFSFGDARFFGSTGSLRLNRPIVGMTASPTGNGYWFVASDGGIFSFGDARFFGSTGARPPGTPIVGMGATPSGQGYFLAAAGGGVFAFGDARPGVGDGGSTGGVVAMTVLGPQAYRLIGADGRIAGFGVSSLPATHPGRPVVAGAGS
ncbi:MAG: Esterase [Actinomycetia bacterium]|nr:Esterase [Actinomycetes bacterium]